MKFPITSILILLLSFGGTVHAFEKAPDTLAKISVQHSGRVKPLDTFARAQLLTFYEKSKINGRDAVTWLMDLWVRPDEAVLEPVYRLRNDEVVRSLGLEPVKSHLYTHQEVEKAIGSISHTIHRLGKRSRNERSPAEQQLVGLHHKVQVFRALCDPFMKQTNVLSIVPPHLIGEQERWGAVWELMSTRHHDEKTQEFLQILQDLQSALKAEDRTLITINSKKLSSLQLSKAPLDLELAYNRLAPFTLSLELYLLGLLILGFSLLSKKGWLTRLVGLSIWAGFAMHTVGMVMRMLIMGRPPVSNLYESILFVGWTVVLCGVIIEILKRDRLGYFMAGTGGAILQFVGLKYALEGDTLGMLVAVLDSNFWLATHVVTITLGYGTTFMAGLFAHAYLWAGARKWAALRMANLDGIMRGMVLVSLFFTILGTILGGIWADQSWGRFWGWDPKENGALLIVIWLLLLIHGRKSNWIGAPAYAFLLTLGNIVVAVAWFGVNLLNVGLHSYGFTDSIATNLLGFSSTQILLGTSLYIWAKVKLKERGPVILSHAKEASSDLSDSPLK